MMIEEKTYEEIMSEAHAEGRLDGQTRMLLRQFSTRLQRELDPAERAALLAHVTRLGPDRVSDVVVERDVTSLLAWLHARDAS